MRIVLDVNVLVRANTRAVGPARELLELIRSNAEHVLITSRPHPSGGQAQPYPRLQAVYGLTEAGIQERLNLLQRLHRG